MTCPDPEPPVICPDPVIADCPEHPVICSDPVIADCPEQSSPPSCPDLECSECQECPEQDDYILQMPDFSVDYLK